MNFLEKYIKYKKRYLSLKKNMIGGLQMVFVKDKTDLRRLCRASELYLHNLEYPEVDEYLTNAYNEQNKQIEDSYTYIKIPNLKTNCLRHYVRQRMFKICKNRTKFLNRYDFLYSYNLITCNLIIIYDKDGSFGMFHVDAENTFNDLVVFYKKFTSPKEIYIFIPGISVYGNLNTIRFVQNFLDIVKANVPDIIIHPKIIGITDGLDWEKKEINEIKIVNEYDNFDYEWDMGACYVIAKRNEIIVTFREYVLESYKDKIEQFNRFLEYEKNNLV